MTREEKNIQWHKIHDRLIFLVEKYDRIVLVCKILGGLAGGLLFLIIVLFFLTLFGVFGSIPNRIDLADIKNHIASEVFAENDVLLGKYYVENRISIPIDSVSNHVVEALVATEDARFFDHSGIDFWSWPRVLIKSVVLRQTSSGGGSTLSQQLIKNLYSRKEYAIGGTLINKFREMILAIRLEKVYSKPDILKLYLNTVPFPDNVFGIEMASVRFFGKHAQNLTLEESATLVGSLKANALFHPLRRPGGTLSRRNVVLTLMTRNGSISSQWLDSLRAIPLIVDYQEEHHSTGLAPYFRSHLRIELQKVLNEIQEETGEGYNLYKDGLKIYTTINADFQFLAQKAVDEHMARLQRSFERHWPNRRPWEKNPSLLATNIRQTNHFDRLKKQNLSWEEILDVFEQPRKLRIYPKVDTLVEMSWADSIRHHMAILQAGVLAADPKSGAVLAWVGGVDHRSFKYDHVKASRPVGSVFKPIVYTAALENGIEPCAYFDNLLTTYTQHDDWTPKNADGAYGGVYSMTGGLQNSVNTVAVEVMMQTGLDSVVSMARKLGLTNVPEVPSIALGTAESSLYDLIGAYSAFLNEGRPKKLHYLERIVDKHGKVIYERGETVEKEAVFSLEHAAVMTHMLESVVDSGTARSLRYRFDIRGDIAGKTGTTQNHSDGWFIGWNPEIIAGVWVGGRQPSVRFRSLSLGQGASTALPIWGLFVKYLQKQRLISSNATFPELADSLRMALDCAPYLDERPLELDSIFLSDEGQILRHLLDIFKSKETRSNDSETKKRNRISRHSEEIQKKNDRIRKKREKQRNKKSKKR